MSVMPGRRRNPLTLRSRDQTWPHEGSPKRESRRSWRPMRPVPATIAVLATVVVAASCSSDGDEVALSGTAYADAMTTICLDTDDRLAALPTPPEQISATNWAAEVARAFSAEATSSAALRVDASIRELHRSFTTTTEDLADSYDDLSATLAAEADTIGTVNAEITELSLGRDDVATELGIDACRRSGR